MSDFVYKRNRFSMSKPKTLFFLVSLAFLLLPLSLLSCGNAPADSGELMAEFRESYGVWGEIYFKSAKEGEGGYVRESFLSELLGEDAPKYTEDFAYLSASGTDVVFECTLLLCNSEYDALRAIELLERRRSLIDSVTDFDMKKNSFIVKKGRCLVLGIIPDAERAESLWRKIL